MKLIEFAWQDGMLRLLVEGTTANEATMVAADLLSYINKGKPSASRTDIASVEVLRDAQPATEPRNGHARHTKAEVVEAALAVTGKDFPPGPDGTHVVGGPLDLAVFGRLTKLQEIVKEIVKQGATDFIGVKARIAEIMAAEACPTLDRIASLDERLQTCCAALAVPGAV